MEILTVGEMRTADQLAIAAGTSGFALMLSAGRAVAAAAMDLAPRGPILVVAGGGNNGGDGFVAAAELVAHGRDVTLALLGDREALTGDAALAALPATRRVGSKPFAVEGRNVLTEEWEFPIAGQRYDSLQAGVQLANRTGPLNEIEYSEYVMKAQHFADALGGAPEFPDMLHEVARARELDEFAATHDAQLSFTLRARLTAWSPGFVHQQAARLGFTAGAIPGRMVLPAEEPGLPPVLGLVFDPRAALSEDPEQSAINSLALSLDVPQVHRNARPFGRLRDVAFALAEVMDGEITDDTGQPLRTEMIDKIGQDLAQLYDTLDAHDLAAGSPQARRLFS